jgi:hypothetical protein
MFVIAAGAIVVALLLELGSRLLSQPVRVNDGRKNPLTQGHIC